MFVFFFFLRQLDFTIFSDRFFSYLFSPIVLLAFSFISQAYQINTVSRFPTKAAAIRAQLIENIIAATFVVISAFLPFMIAQIIFNSSAIPLTVILSYLFSYLLASINLSVITMLCWCMNTRNFRAWASAIAYAILFTELNVIVPGARRLLGHRLYLVFSWVYYDGAVKYLVLSFTAILAIALLFCISKKCDWV